MLMPIYEYHCRKCDHDFEILVDGEGDAECPRCKTHQLERVLSLPAQPARSAAGQSTCTADPNVPPCGPMCGRWKG
jgi:putative FmdB family regulatory protein